MQITALLALAPFLGAAVAVPRQAHEKFHQNKKRDITWFTVTSEVIETVYETTTIWVQPGQAAPSPAPSPESPASPPAASPSTPVAASPSESPAAAATSSGLVGLQSPSPNSPPAQSPAPQSPPAESPSPVPASPSPAPKPASPSPAPAPAPSSAPAAQPSSGAESSSGGSSYPVSTLPGASSPDGPCTPGSKCTGQGTFYSVGSGACGGTSVDSDLVVALPVQIMGSQSNGGGSANPLCERSVMVQLFEANEPIKAAVVDKCMGCNTPYSLDMSTGLFEALGGDQSVGRYSNVTWFWA